MKRQLGWYWFTTDKSNLLEEHKCGKWMHFFTDQQFAITVCEKAIAEKVCYDCKCTDMERTGKKTGVICFYINGDDMESHRKVIKYMLDNNLIPKIKSGKIKNMSFKFDDQTRAGEYGIDYDGKIKLEQFIDLDTGEWIIK